VVDISFDIIDNTATVMVIIGTILFIFVCTKRRELKKWISSYLFVTIGQLISSFSELIPEAGLLSNLSFAIAVILLFVSSLREYYSMFMKDRLKPNQSYKATYSASSIFLLFLGIEFFIIILIIVSLFFTLKIFFKNKSPTYASICLTLIGGLLTILSSTLRDLEILDSNEFGVGMTIFFASTLLFTGIIALIELQIESSKNILKDVLKASSNVSLDVANVATELAASASEVNAASEEISNSTQETVIFTQKIMEASNKIRNIMQIITDISEQTNLLALNASIEAGRAGEQGRGFAVVANEVRKLAENSRNAIFGSYEEINEIINMIQDVSHSMMGISSSAEQQTASMEEISATANRLDNLAEKLKKSLIEVKT
jgi:hypothetical protein